jgi:hypothetical protein
MKEKKSNIVYVPIVKSKGGERWALSNLLPETKPRVRPVVELHAHKTKSFNEHLEELCEDLAEALGSNRFYMDGIWLHDELGDPSILTRIFARARAHGLRVIPVVRPTFSTASLHRVRDIVEEDGRGYLIRGTHEEIADEVRIERTVESVGLPCSKVDLLLDYRGRSMTLDEEVASIAHLSEWRRLIAASGVFPRSVADLTLTTWQNIERCDWTSWQGGIASGLPRDPVYSDYVTRAPGAPAQGGNPPVHLRYTSDDIWAVRVDGRHQDGDAVEMHNICESLIEQPFFRGAEFSAGDMEIVRTADPDEGPGGPMQWLQWCVSHHIEQVVDQLTSVAA